MKPSLPTPPQALQNPYSPYPTACISDNGLPIPEEAARNLFTPFFSTKPDGKGIGLAVIHEVLTRSGIRFSLATGPDGLTRFELFFR